MFSCLEIDVEISDNSMKTTEYGECRKLLEVNGVANKMLTVIQRWTEIY